jgi:hypothetical protein
VQVRAEHAELAEQYVTERRTLKSLRIAGCDFSTKLKFEL